MRGQAHFADGQKWASPVLLSVRLRTYTLGATIPITILLPGRVEVRRSDWSDAPLWVDDLSDAGGRL